MTKIKAKKIIEKVKQKKSIKVKKDIPAKKVKEKVVKREIYPYNISNINIVSDKFDYYSFYVFEHAKLDKKLFDSNILIFQFDNMPEAMEFYKKYNFSMNEWNLLPGDKFLKKYSFLIVELRKYLNEKNIKKKK